MIAVASLLATLLVLSGLDSRAWRPKPSRPDAVHGMDWPRCQARRRLSLRRRASQRAARLPGTPALARWWWE